MIYSVHGKLIAKTGDLAVVECAGVGYACRTTQVTLSELGSVGDDVMLYTHLSVREDAVELFGFADMQELHCFEMLTSVSGVGPKAALAILSDLSADRFALVVASGDSKTLTKSKGIGAKTAQRIVLELKDKIAKENKDSDWNALSESAVCRDDSAIGDAISALMVLGYSQEEVMPLLLQLDKTLSSEELIKETLKLIGSRR
ncbi:MAG: Holliday junction branch migration protein RuvA [Oscillospiraceae bacterium]|nr:Holliday junction branch migration protein RuvA [Oscillospiraceae bacterium]